MFGFTENKGEKIFGLKNNLYILPSFFLKLEKYERKLFKNYIYIILNNNIMSFLISFSY